MGCSSSARSRPQEPPTTAAAGPPPRASSGENTPTADDHETVADQTQLDPVEDVSLASKEINPGEHPPGEEAVAMILAVEEKIDLVSKREEPEGTEPLPAGAEESSELPSAWREESNGPSPPAPGEDAGVPPPEPAEDSGLVEGSDTSVVEIIKKVHITEEDNLVEGETGEQVETELLSEIVSGGPETKEEETGEAVDGAAATEIGMLTEEGRTTWVVV
ncbi:glutamate-rich protein 5 isoform X1 [Grus americana]|uniref:glutamate-rich protein 5 isoform X1 n=1 Tax=Grus americana TaxID=9117 RepID=UPI0024080F7B|nr:glutamate-rich protein 5 isoform X1 [Grus americana]